MPELPEVETVRRALIPHVEGQLIRTVHVARHDLRRPVPEDLGQRLTGRLVERLDRRGKLLLWHLDSGEVILIHLGMSGSLGINNQDPPRKHDHIQLTLESGDRVTFHDPRRFGFFDLCSEDQLLADPLLSEMGPDPVAEDFTADMLKAALANRRGPIKTVLLDQHVVAGLGNIYVCEALFQSHIAPDRPANSLTDAEAATLTDAIGDVLSRAVAVGGSTLKDHRKPDGSTGYFQIQLQVYGHEGDPCPRYPDAPEHTIQRKVQAGRSTFYCPACQS